MRCICVCARMQSHSSADVRVFPHERERESARAGRNRHWQGHQEGSDSIIHRALILVRRQTHPKTTAAKYSTRFHSLVAAASAADQWKLGLWLVRCRRESARANKWRLQRRSAAGRWHTHAIDLPTSLRVAAALEVWCATSMAHAATVDTCAVPCCSPPTAAGTNSISPRKLPLRCQSLAASAPSKT